MPSFSQPEEKGKFEPLMKELVRLSRQEKGETHFLVQYLRMLIYNIQVASAMIHFIRLRFPMSFTFSKSGNLKLLMTISKYIIRRKRTLYHN